MEIAPVPLTPLKQAIVFRSEETKLLAISDQNIDPPYSLNSFAWSRKRTVAELCCYAENNKV